MSARRIHAALLFLAVALFSLGASVPLACCAGVAGALHATGEAEAAGASSHCGGDQSGERDEGGRGGSCCDRAADDAVARRCCEGGDSFERPLVPSFSAPALAATLDAVPLPSRDGFASSLATPSARDAIPRLEPLYTLHASLLI
jgi:hypothetical protein